MVAVKRTILVGDVHGCFKELKLLLAKCAYKPKTDRLILLGDLVDRGPHSVEVVQWARNRGIECLSGNHDEKYARFHKHETKKFESLKRGEEKPYKNPMRFKESRREIYGQLSEADLKWIDEMPTSIFLEEYNMLCVHAGVQAGVSLSEQPAGTLRHHRYVDNDTLKAVNLTGDYHQPKNSSFWAEHYDGFVNIVHGHHVGSMKDPVIYVNAGGARVIGTDTGACFGGRLTALVLSEEDREGSFVQVDALEVYRER